MTILFLTKCFFTAVLVTINNQLCIDFIRFVACSDISKKLGQSYVVLHACIQYLYENLTYGFIINTIQAKTNIINANE